MSAETFPATLRKSVFAVHIRPMAGALNLKGRKLQVALARLAGEQYRRLSAAEREHIETGLREFMRRFRAGELRPDQAPFITNQPHFVAGLKDLAVLVGHDPSDARHLWDDLRRLQVVQVQFNTLEHGAAEAERELYPDDVDVVTTLASGLSRSGRGYVAWSYDARIFSVMVNPRTYAQLNLELVRNARTYTALALYENVKRFVGIGRAGPYPVRRWQELLSENGKVPAWEDSAEFKRKVRRALAELDACEGCDVHIDFREVHIPGAGKGVEFGVKMRPQTQLVFGEPIPENKQLVEDLERIGFSTSESRALLESHGEEYLYAKLTMLRKAQASTEVRNARGWLVSALERDFRDEELEQQKIREQNLQQEAQRLEKKRLKEAFDELRSKRVEQLHAQLPADEQRKWLQRYLATEAGLRAQVTLKPDSKAFQASFLHWLCENSGWLTQDHETDFLSFVLWAKSQEQLARA